MLLFLLFYNFSGSAWERTLYYIRLNQYKWNTYKCLLEFYKTETIIYINLFRAHFRNILLLFYILKYEYSISTIYTTLQGSFRNHLTSWNIICLCVPLLWISLSFVRKIYEHLVFCTEFLPFKVRSVAFKVLKLIYWIDWPIMAW